MSPGYNKELYEGLKALGFWKESNFARTGPQMKNFMGDCYFDEVRVKLMGALAAYQTDTGLDMDYDQKMEFLMDIDISK